MDLKLKCRLCYDQLQDYEIDNIVTSDIQTQIVEIFPSIYLFGDQSNSLCDRCFSKINDISSFRKEILQKQKNLSLECLQLEDVVIKLESDCLILEESELKQEILFTEEIQLQETKTKPIKKRKPVSQKKNKVKKRYLRSNPKLAVAIIHKDGIHATCEFCGKVVRKVSLNSHLNKVHYRKTNVECDLCGERFFQKSEVRSHIESHLRNSNRKRYRYGGIQRNDFNESEPVNTSKNLKVTSLNVTCEICGKVMKRRSLYSHLNFIHYQKTKFECDLCGERFYQRGRLRSHMESHIRQRQKRKIIYPCNVCGEQFKSVARVFKHRMSVHSEEPTEVFSCHCGKQFSSPHNLQVHINLKHIKQEHKCKECDKIFYDKTYLTQHFRDHHRPRNTEVIICNVCGKVLTSTRKFIYHMASHEKKFICEEPGCGKKFAANFKLRQHKEINHIKAGDHKCPYEECKRTYNTRGLLRKHIASSHLKIQFNCPAENCTYKNQRKEYMKKHINNHHKNLEMKEFKRIAEAVEKMKFIQYSDGPLKEEESRLILF